MSQSPPTKKPPFEFTKKSAIVLTSILIALAWLVYLARILFNVDLLNWRGNRQPLDPSILLYIVIACTVIAAVWCITTIRKLDVLAKRGVPTTATVTSVSMLAKFGESPVTITYTVNGKEYSSRRDLSRSDFKTGDTVQIIYDPQNPNTWKLA